MDQSSPLSTAEHVILVDLETSVMHPRPVCRVILARSSE